MAYRAVSLFALILIMLLFSACSSKRSEDKNEAPQIGSAKPTVPEKGPETEAKRFEDIEYKRPDIDKITTTFAAASRTVKDKNIPVSKRKAILRDCRDLYFEYMSAKSLSEIYFSMDIYDPLIREEFTELYTAYPTILGAVDKLLFAVADCGDRELLQSELFVNVNLEEYKSSPRFTDRAIELMTKEASLEASYLSLSTATVNISYDGTTASFDETERRLRERYGIDSPKYENAMKICREKYQKRLTTSTVGIYTELLKVRRQLADEFGVKNYDELLCSFSVFDYSASEAGILIEDTSKYLLPIRAELSEIFDRYFYSHHPKSIDGETIKVNLSGVYSDMNKDFGAKYKEMLGGSLYNTEKESQKRRKGPFISYIPSEKAAFMFMNISGGLSDHTDISNQFGRYLNADKHSRKLSLELWSLAGDGFELLTLSSLSDRLGKEDYKYLLYSELDSLLDELTYQSFYSELELSLYNLSYSELNEQTLDRLASELSKKYGLDYKDFYSVIGEQQVISPLYSRAKCVSLAVALELFLKEEKTRGTGVKIYGMLFSEEESFDLNSSLLKLGLDSPSEQKKLMKLSDELYYMIQGFHYFDDSENDNSAT